MSTINGFGTLYYGWRHFDDGTATATKWFALSWVPVFPIYKERLRVLSNFNSGHAELKSELGGLVVSQVDRYEIIERLPISGREVMLTYAKTYLGLPILFFGPILLGFIFFLLIPLKHGVEVKPGDFVFNLFIGSVFISLINILIQSVRCIRRARGWQPRV
jgi:hypothetical protein